MQQDIPKRRQSKFSNTNATAFYSNPASNEGNVQAVQNNGKDGVMFFSSPRNINPATLNPGDPLPSYHEGTLDSSQKPIETWKFHSDVNHLTKKIGFTSNKSNSDIFNVTDFETKNVG